MSEPMPRPVNCVLMVTEVLMTRQDDDYPERYQVMLGSRGLSFNWRGTPQQLLDLLKTSPFVEHLNLFESTEI